MAQLVTPDRVVLGSGPQGGESCIPLERLCSSRRGLVGDSTRALALTDRLKRGKGEDGKKLSEAERTSIAEELAGRQAALHEFENYAPVYPNVNVRVYAAEFAGSDKENLEFFQESMDGLVKALFEQIPK